jgi:hypothetical protein
MCLQACYTGIFGHLQPGLHSCATCSRACHLQRTVTTQPPTTRASSAADHTGSNTNTCWGWLSYHSRTINLVVFGSRTAALHASFKTVVAEPVEGLRFSRSLGWFVQGSKHHA